MSDEFVTVTKEEFYGIIWALDLDCFPYNHNPDFTSWEIRDTRRVIGITTPGWRDSGLPESIQSRTYKILRSLKEGVAV